MSASETIHDWVACSIRCWSLYFLRLSITPEPFVSSCERADNQANERRARFGSRLKFFIARRGDSCFAALESSNSDFYFLVHLYLYRCAAGDAAPMREDDEASDCGTRRDAELTFFPRHQFACPSRLGGTSDTKQRKNAQAVEWATRVGKPGWNWSILESETKERRIPLDEGRGRSLHAVVAIGMFRSSEI